MLACMIAKCALGFHTVKWWDVNDQSQCTEAHSEMIRKRFEFVGKSEVLAS